MVRSYVILSGICDLLKEGTWFVVTNPLEAVFCTEFLWFYSLFSTFFSANLETCRGGDFRDSRVEGPRLRIESIYLLVGPLRSAGGGVHLLMKYF